MHITKHVMEGGGGCGAGIGDPTTHETNSKYLGLGIQRLQEVVGVALVVQLRRLEIGGSDQRWVLARVPVDEDVVLLLLRRRRGWAHVLERSTTIRHTHIDIIIDDDGESNNVEAEIQ